MNTERKIQEYLHMYGIGSMVFFDRHQREVVGLSKRYVKMWKKKPGTDLGNSVEANYNEVKLILRPLSDMTVEEVKFVIGKTMLSDVSLGKSEKEFAINIAQRWVSNSQVFAYLLSRGFDLFNLIPDGLAINKTTLQP